MNESQNRHFSSSNDPDSDANPELVACVLRAIEHHRTKSEIIEMICNRTGWDWRQAASFLNRVEAEYEGELSRREIRLTFPFGIGISLIGIILFWFGISNNMWYWKQIPLLFRIPNTASCQICLDMQPLYQFLAQYDYFFGEITPSMIVNFFLLFIAPILGIGMTIGGIVGIIQSWRKLRYAGKIVQA